MTMNRIGLGLAWLAFVVASGARAQQPPLPSDLPIIGAPVPGGVNYQPAVTSVAHDTHWLSGMVHSIMLVIVLFVTALLLIVVFRYNTRRNPEPASFTHNTRIEIAWTLIPVVILIVIGAFSLPILFKQLEVPTPDLTIKATGNQWYWSYNYPENDFTFDSLMLAEEDLAANGYPPSTYLLATDTAIVVPVDKVVHVLVTGSDVIHAFTVPAFGIKIDAVPGRLNETWFKAEEEGIYFGQCSELCGKNHSFMPITVKVVSQEAYDTWLNWAIDEYGGTRPEAPGAGAAAAAEPPAAEPPATEPATEPVAPAATEPAAPAATEPAAPAATEPAATEPAAPEATEPPATEPPATEPPAAEDPAAAQPTAAQPTAEEPTAEQPTEHTPAENETPDSSEPGKEPAPAGD
jgi:cytochrome c oxidase subunit II